MAVPDAVANREPAAWRVNDWRQQVPISRTKFYEQRNAGLIRTVKVGAATLVLTSPQEYLAALRDERAATAPRG